MKLKTFTIIERKWARGGQKGYSALLNDEGNKCCLGFLCSKAGFRRLTDASMPDSLASPAEVSNPYPVARVVEKLSGLVRGKYIAIQTAAATKIARINDAEDITDDQRKRKLAPLFAKIGWKPVYK